MLHDVDSGIIHVNFDKCNAKQVFTPGDSYLMTLSVNISHVQRSCLDILVGDGKGGEQFSTLSPWLRVPLCLYAHLTYAGGQIK